MEARRKRELTMTSTFDGSGIWIVYLLPNIFRKVELTKFGIHFLLISLVEQKLVENI